MKPWESSQGMQDPPRPNLSTCEAHSVANYSVNKEFRRFTAASAVLVSERKSERPRLAREDELPPLAAGVTRGARFRAGLLREVAAKLNLAPTTIQAALMVRDGFVSLRERGPELADR